MNVNDLCDYIIVKASEAGVGLNLLKVQKIAYYAEAWFEAFHKRALTGERFQAWVHGPVSRSLYDRFRETKSLYSPVDERDVRSDFDLSGIAEDERRHVDEVLEVYGGYDGSQLEDMTHNEEPWIAARGGCRPSERCETVIDPALMRSYYAARLVAMQPS